MSIVSSLQNHTWLPPSRRSIFSISWILGVLFLSLIVNHPLAHSQDLTRNPLLRQGLSLYNDQKYPQAILIFKQVLKWAASSPKDKIEALKYLAFTNIILGKGAVARAYFLKILNRSPSFQLDSAWYPPKFVRFFNPIRKEFLLSRRVLIKGISIPVELPKDKPLILKFKVIDNKGRMTDFLLRYRISGTLRYIRRFLNDEKGILKKVKTGKLKPQKRTYIFKYKIPVALGSMQEGAYFLEYYAVALDKESKVLATMGTAKKPKRIKRTYVEPPPDKREVAQNGSILNKWWFWTGVGVVVIGGATAGIIAATSNKTPPPPNQGAVIINVVRKQ